MCTFVLSVLFGHFIKACYLLLLRRLKSLRTTFYCLRFNILSLVPRPRSLSLCKMALACYGLSSTNDDCPTPMPASETVAPLRYASSPSSSSSTYASCYTRAVTCWHVSSMFAPAHQPSYLLSQNTHYPLPVPFLESVLAELSFSRCSTVLGTGLIVLANL